VRSCAISFSGRLYNPFAGMLSLHPRELDAPDPDEFPEFGRGHAAIAPSRRGTDV
jgi:hypothetical protein